MIPQAALECADVQALRFHANIQASDGEAGRLVALIVNEQGQAVTHLGIRVNRFHRRRCFVPVQLVTAATADMITLDIPLDAIAVYTKKPSGCLLTRATQVRASAALLGQLAQVAICRQARALDHIVVTHGWGRAVLVPARMVTGVTAGQVTVQLDRESPDQLVRYCSDDRLRQAVYDALFGYAPLRSDLAGIEIHPQAGAVWLSGHISSAGKRRLAAYQLRDLAGMSALHNALVADDELGAAVSMALAHDQRTAGQHIGVYPHLGAVHLRGTTQTSGARESASGVAGAVRSVTQVKNELRVASGSSGGGLPVLAGVTNEDDHVPGGT